MLTVKGYSKLVARKGNRKECLRNEKQRKTNKKRSQDCRELCRFDKNDVIKIMKNRKYI